MNGQCYTHYMGTVLITGGSEGIGLELAKLYAAAGNELILCARDRVKLHDAKHEVQKLYHVRCETVSLDLSGRDAAKTLYEQFKDRRISTLINNAGIGFTGKSWEIPLEAEETMVRLNDETLMSLTKLFLNDFIARGEGTIVNVASTGAFQPGPYIAGYYASKAFVLNYTKALAEETRGTGVHVCCLCPGPVDTHFYMKSGGKKPRFIMSAEKTARIAYEKIQKGKTVIVPGLINNLVRVLPLSMRIAYVKKTKLKNLNRKTKR